MSARAFERFISALFAQEADELVLESGRTVRLRKGNEERKLLAQNIRTHQIESLLSDAVPLDQLTLYRRDGEVKFPYASASGTVNIRCYRKGNRLAVRVLRVATPVAPHAADSRMVIEGPLDNVMANSNHGMSIVTGEPTNTAPPHAGQVGAHAPVPMVPRHDTNAPLELQLESILPPRLPSNAFVPTGIGSADVAAPMNVAPPAPVGQPAPVAPPMVTARAATPLASLPPLPGVMGNQAPVHPSEPTLHGNTAANIAAQVAAASSMQLAEPPPVMVQPQLAVPPPVAAQPPPPQPQAVPTPAPQAVPTPAPQAVVPSAPQIAPPPVVAAPASSRRNTIQPIVGPCQIDPILRRLAEVGGSDLHLTAQMAPRMRKDGEICPVPGYEQPLSSDTIRAWVMEIAPSVGQEDFIQTSDADYAYEIPGVSRFRVNVFRDRRGVGAVMRTIPCEILTADQLGLPPAVRELCTLDKGLVTVTGPTGSGKSTTLAAMIDLINSSRSDHIITIEDPVEFVHEPKRCLINQREVHVHTRSFSAALRAALREDPDIVLVGEMRDLETISIALETAETGHLVFGTLHTNTAISTVDRIIDQFPVDRQAQVRVMLSESLRAVIAQTLCKKIGGGRCAALEIMLAVPAVANLIREGKTFQIASIMQTGRGIGMQTLSDALIALVKDRKITPEQAYRKALNKSEMKQQLQRAGHTI